MGFYSAVWLNGKFKMKGFDESSGTYDFVANNTARFDFGPNAGAKIEYVLANGKISLDFSYELGLADLENRIGDNTENVNRSFLTGVSYMKALGKNN